MPACEATAGAAPAKTAAAPAAIASRRDTMPKEVVSRTVLGAGEKATPNVTKKAEIRSFILKEELKVVNAYVVRVRKALTVLNRSEALDDGRYADDDAGVLINNQRPPTASTFPRWD